MGSPGAQQASPDAGQEEHRRPVPTTVLRRPPALLDASRPQCSILAPNRELRPPASTAEREWQHRLEGRPEGQCGRES
eukprot:8925142-Alexandrium_andersonii.AAC.1